MCVCDLKVERFYMHSIGHWVGMDVHDVHDISTRLPFAPGAMVTVEPGLYIPDEPDIPERYLKQQQQQQIVITNNTTMLRKANNNNYNDMKCVP